MTLGFKSYNIQYAAHAHDYQLIDNLASVNRKKT